ncbi:MAG: c-type cytochrome [Myxococcaceae bacterium]|nr:c-type cytochrome [Myxococcaceae bacterium]
MRLLCLTAPLLLLAPAVWAQNLADGKDVYGPCAACHGANGEGGKGGEYPRIAGQPASFIIESLKGFQTRSRYNLPMIPYTEPRELSERDMKDVAAWVESIQLPSRMPVLPESATALERLLAAERVLVVPRVAGDVDKGKARYLEECADCHGKDGRGRASRDAPMLVGQYPDYLLRQVDEFKKGKRGAAEGHPMNGVLAELTSKDISDVLAFLTSIQDQDPPPSASTAAPDAGVPATASEPARKR